MLLRPILNVVIHCSFIYLKAKKKRKKKAFKQAEVKPCQLLSWTRQYSPLAHCCLTTVMTSLMIDQSLNCIECGCQGSQKK